MSVSYTTTWVMCATLFGQAAESTPPDERRAARLEALQAVVDAVELQSATSPPQTFARSAHPVLKYTNPVTSRFAEGVMYFWLDERRPVAAVSTSIRDDGAIYWELSSLSDKPLRLSRNGSVVWKPKSGGHPSARVPEAPPPAETAAARLIQMRQLARRFRLREERREAWQDGRLLTQPLYRWDHAADGVIDGALFGFAETTDPELLLMFEARHGDGDAPQWWFSVAKMTSSPVEVYLDDRQIWSVGGYWRNPRSPEDPYVEAKVGQIDPSLNPP